MSHVSEHTSYCEATIVITVERSYFLHHFICYARLASVRLKHSRLEKITYSDQLLVYTKYSPRIC